MKIHGTAKGGALSKKDFGVAFGGAPTECEDDNSGTKGGDGSEWGLAAGAFPLGLGMSFASGHVLIDKEILNMTVWLQISGTSLGTGTLKAYLWEGSGDPATPDDYRAVSDGVSSGTIASSPDSTEVTFTFSSPATLQAGDYMSVQLPSISGSSINFVSNGSSYETNTIAQEFRSSWTQKTFGNRFKIKYTC